MEQGTGSRGSSVGLATLAEEGKEGKSKEKIFEQNVAAFQERSAAFREKTFFKRKKNKNVYFFQEMRGER